MNELTGMVQDACLTPEYISNIFNSTGFCTLSLSDQMNLLQHSWLEILCLNLVFRSCPYNGYLKFAEDLQLSVDECKLCHCSPELDGLSRKLAKKFTEMEVTKEEYLLLKAMTLCNIGIVDHIVKRSISSTI